MEITEAEPLPAYRLELRFDNGEHGVVDLLEFVGRRKKREDLFPSLHNRLSHA